jgi:hypothetical protein
MTWSTALAQGAIDALSVALIIRLHSQRLTGVYRVLKWYLFFGLVESVVWFVYSELAPLAYNLPWVVLKFIDCAFTLWIVYAVLNQVLRNLPGVLNFSRKLLNGTFLAAIGFSLWTARAEYTTSIGAAALTSRIGHLVAVTSIVNRAISTAELTVIIAILCFVLWFPVQIPKNLAVLTVGLVIYFAANTVSWLAWSFWSSRFHAVDDLVAFVLVLCLVFWTVGFSRAGETLPVRIGHLRPEREHERLLVQLEAINASLLRAARR